MMLTQAKLDSMGEEEIQDIVMGLASDVDFHYSLDQGPKEFIKIALRRNDLTEGLTLRRAYDGVSEVSWMVQKMIGEKLAEGKARL